MADKGYASGHMMKHAILMSPQMHAEIQRAADDQRSSFNAAARDILALGLRARSEAQNAERFTIGARVAKPAGYDWPGLVAGYGYLSTGTVLAMVENRLSPGTAHVFPSKGLVLETRSDAAIMSEVRRRFLTPNPKGDG